MVVAHPVSRSRTPAPDLTSTLFRRDGSARLFLDDQVVGALAQKISGSSYPETSHLVGICPPDTVVDAVAAAQPQAVAPDDVSVVALWSRGVALPSGGRSEARWARERLEWQTAALLREMLSNYHGALCSDCGTEGRVMQHNLSDRQRLTPYRCNTRSTCPMCGLAYGQTRGGELVELLDALLQPGRLVQQAPTVAAWHPVLSCDQRVSAYVAQLVDSDDRDQLRRVMRHLTEDVHAALRAVYGAGVAGIVAWHWWHSANPLAEGMHLHAHVTVPNVSVTLDPDTGRWVPDLRPLRTRGVLADHELADLRLTFGERVCSHRWVRALGIDAPERGRTRQPRRCWQPNVHVRFTTGRDGQGYGHRLRYDARVSVVDVLGMVLPDEVRDSRHLHESLLGEHNSGAAWDSAVCDIAEMACQHDQLARWVRRAQVWQSVQTVRYTGWLVNAARKSLGLLRDPGDDQDAAWSSVGVYRVVEAGPELVTVERWTSRGRERQDWHRDHVQLMPPPTAPAGWLWDDVARPRVVGPPLAWLAQSGLDRGSV